MRKYHVNYYIEPRRYTSSDSVESQFLPATITRKYRPSSRNAAASTVIVEECVVTDATFTPQVFLPDIDLILAFFERMNSIGQAK